MSAAALCATEPDLALAADLFAHLDRATRVGQGIVRASYGKGENIAHHILGEAATVLDLRTEVDAAGNLYMTLPGTAVNASRLVIGSHLDSVAQGGNYDGAAGVVAGLSVLAGFRRAGRSLPYDVTVMAIRAEESVWFSASYVGSYAAFGRLPAEALAIPRSDTGRTLRQHMREAGFDPDAVERGSAHLQPSKVQKFVEVHIEQGPVLVERDVPVGLVTAIRGCLRFADAHCFGRYAHSGAEPRRSRQDAVLATIRLIGALQDEAERIEAEGDDIAFTVGVLTTDSAVAAPSKVAGETHFALDIRSVSDAVMRRMEGQARLNAEVVGETHKVRFALGVSDYSRPARMSDGMRRTLGELARDLAIPFIEMPSGAGHDAAVFAEMDVSSAMIFIRNRGGSHNVTEEMDLADFAAAARLLAAYVETGA